MVLGCGTHVQRQPVAPLCCYPGQCCSPHRYSPGRPRARRAVQVNKAVKPPLDPAALRASVPSSLSATCPPASGHGSPSASLSAGLAISNSPLGCFLQEATPPPPATAPPARLGGEKPPPAPVFESEETDSMGPDAATVSRATTRHQPSMPPPRSISHPTHHLAHPSSPHASLPHPSSPHASSPHASSPHPSSLRLPHRIPHTAGRARAASARRGESRARDGGSTTEGTLRLQRHHGGRRRLPERG